MPFQLMFASLDPVPMIHLGTFALGGKKQAVTPGSIAAGQGDGYLIALNQAISQWGKAIYVRPLAEMNNSGNVWSGFLANGSSRGPAYTPAEYRKAFARRTTRRISVADRLRIATGHPDGRALHHHDQRFLTGVDELVEIRRSRRARRWTITIPWGEPVLLTVPAGMREREIAAVIESHREWIARERAAQVPRLRLNGRRISEAEGRQAARELVGMVLDEEAPVLGVSYGRVEIRNQRTRWGSCSSSGALSFNWRLALAPFEVLDYVVVHELCHLLQPNHSARFWNLVASRRPNWHNQRDWLTRHGPELLAFRPVA